MDEKVILVPGRGRVVLVAGVVHDQGHRHRRHLEVVEVVVARSIGRALVAERLADEVIQDLDRLLLAEIPNFKSSRQCK